MGHPNYLKFHTEETKNKISKKLKGKKHPWVSERTGEKHPRWIGGSEFWKKNNERNDGAYQHFVKKVKQRDNYTCKINNKDCSGSCIVHHILPLRDYPELIYNINNGITLCQAHHPRKWAEEKLLAPTFQELISQIN
jgi:hypothetical protein